VRYWKSKHVPEKDHKFGVAVACYVAPDDRRRVWALMCLLHSLRAQTYQNWHVVIMHDGPVVHPDLLPSVETLDADKKVVLVQTPERKLKFGHPWRQRSIDLLAEAGCQWVCLTNDDNYYAPVFMEWSVAAALVTPKPHLLVHCDMVHSHKLWKHMTTRAKYRHVDLGGVVAHVSLAKRVAFNKFEFNGDGDWINRMAAIAGKRVAKVPATLFVHN
jgi:hypothetical protein